MLPRIRSFENKIVFVRFSVAIIVILDTIMACDNLSLLCFLFEGTLLVSILDFLGTGANLISSYLSNKYSNKLASRAEDKAWERETAYNHPAAQMSRLREAGLSPNLMYGGGLTATGNTHASVHNRQSLDLPESLSQYHTLKRLSLDNELARRSIQNLEAQNANIRAQTRNLESATKYRDFLRTPNMLDRYLSPFFQGIEGFGSFFRKRGK